MLVAKYEPGKKGNISHQIPSSVKTITNESLSNTSTTEVIKSSGIRNEDTKPLCTLFLSFPDSQNKEVTTSHIFPNIKPQLYPQTRRTVYKTSKKEVRDGNNSQMSLTSPSLYTDDEIYGRHRLGSTANTKTSSTRSTPTHLYDNQLVQEVSLTYSAPYTSVAKPHEPLAVQIGINPNSIDEYSKVYEENGNNLHSYYSDYSGRYSAQKQRNLESVERLLTSGKIETEFPIKHLASSPEEIPYFSAQSAIQSGKTTPAYTPRATPVGDSRASTVRLPSALSHNTVISESTTIEELTTITTTNRQKSDMPTVNALTEQFERSASRENKETLKSRKSPNYGVNNNSNGHGKNSRVVVINRTNQYANTQNNNRVRHIEKPTYSPTGVVTTTIVDIEPPGYGGRKARIEEYRIEEEFISTKTYPAGYYQQKQQQTQTQNSQSQTKEEAVEMYVRSQSRSGANSRSNNNYAEDAPSPTVRNVIEQFETRIEERVRPVSVEKENIPRSVSRVEMNKTDDQQFKEKEIIIHRREIEKPRPVEVPPAPPVVKTFEETTTIRMEGSPMRFEESARKVEEVEEEPSVIESTPRVRPYQPDFIRTYEEERTTTIRRDGGHGSEIRTIVSDPAPVTLEIPRSTIPPPPTPVSPVFENTVITTTTALISGNKSEDEIIIPTAEDSEPEAKTPEPIPEEKTFRKHVEFEPEEKEEINRRKKEEEETYEKFKKEYDRNIRVSTHEEWSTTTRRRKRSLPPPPPPPLQTSSKVETYESSRHYSKGATDLGTDLYSAYDTTRGRTLSRAADRNIVTEIRSISEGRPVFPQAGSYTGMPSALTTGNATVCTTYLRDVREREKREIGMLNDRLADYIEKVRFLEAQNRLHSSDIEHLKKGLGGYSSLHSLFETENRQSKVVIDQIISQRSQFEREVETLTGQINDLRAKLADAIAAIKNHRTNFDVNLERLAQLEAEIGLTRRKINIVEEDVIRVRKENDNVLRDINRIRALTHQEIAGKNEQSLRIQDLLHRIEFLKSENTQKIDFERNHLRIDTTAENREYFRRELQKAMREIREDFDRKSQQTRLEFEQRYRKVVIENQPRQIIESRNDLIQIRHLLTKVRQNFSELENRNLLLQRQIEDLSQQLSSDAREYEISLQEKDALIAKIREQSVELSIQMEKLCDNEITLRAEIERYRSLLNGANVTTYVSNGNARTLVTETTTTSKSTSASHYTYGGGSHLSYPIGGGVGSESGSVATTPTIKPDRIHDEQSEDENGRQFHSWYKGTIRVKKVTSDFIELENICKIRRVDVNGFRVEHRVNGVLLGAVTINHELVLAPKETLKIYSSAAASLNGEFFINVSHFDDSINSRTSIYNATEPTEERGWFIYLS